MVLEDFISLALQVFFKGAEKMISSNSRAFQKDSFTCENIDAKERWNTGAKFYE